MSTIALNAIPELHGRPATMPTGLRQYAVIAAALLHLAVLLWLFDPWRSAPEHAPQLALPVTLVFEPPAQPAEPQPTPQAQSAPQLGYRESGPDAQTTAPPTISASEAKSEEPPAEQAPAAPLPVLPVPTQTAPTTTPKPPATAKLEPPRLTARPKDDKSAGPRHPPMTAQPTSRPPSRLQGAAPGEHETSGDPYFNSVVAALEKHRFYPELARPLGLVGVVRLGMLVDRSGKILGMQLQESSGAELLDRAAEKMIRDTAQVPPPPADIPGDPILIWVGIYVAPR